MRRVMFRPAPALTIFVAIAFAILLSLGSWQLHRLQWKTDLVELVEGRVNAPPVALAEALAAVENDDPAEYLPVVLRGEFLPETTVKLFAIYDATPGAFVFDAFRTREGDIIYVNRGFAPQAIGDGTIALPPEGESTVSGLFRNAEILAPPASWFRRINPDENGYWYVRTPGRFGEVMGLQNTRPFYIDQFARKNVEWPKGGTTRLDFRNKHLEYALTWFGLAATLIAVWIAASLRKRQP